MDRIEREDELDTPAAEVFVMGSAPLHQHRRVVSKLTQPEVMDLFGIAEAIEVGVDEGKISAFEVVNQREGRAGDGARHAAGAREGADEEGLARPERTREEDEIAGSERRSETTRETDRGPSGRETKSEPLPIEWQRNWLS